MLLTFNDVIQSFVRVCDLTSDSVDMIQAGGGNASAKYDANNKAMMLIKASGFLMSEVDVNKGYTQIDLQKISAILEGVKNGVISIEDEATINLRTTDANAGALRPSIETFLHALMPQRYILHVHALTTLIYASSNRFMDDMATQWDSMPIHTVKQPLLVPYEKPGIHLAMAMMVVMNQYKDHYGAIPDVVILQNHGLIVASDDSDKLYELITEVEEGIKIQMALPESFGRIYTKQRLIKKVLNGTWTHKHIFIRANEDRDLVNYLNGASSFPDALVFCGLEPLIVAIPKQNDKVSIIDYVNEALTQYIETYDDFPKVVLFDSDLYFCGESIKKCLEVQDVLKIQWIIRRELGDNLVTLTQEQAHTLLNWEAEKYRKNL